ncbi:uncharacterized protein TNIN_103401 [Trichonephila inaurata madagascariensis]|uniref:Uncharacterized protein n=1 Tax=Trichonephila inaurata madagascariensis TaxID=2747483 RepID=A0A8X7BPX9_9ARAC|nr:uncharacterized protein TNIN_103401 [Trichonephila inaurata madagascariensis]
MCSLIRNVLKHLLKKLNNEFNSNFLSEDFKNLVLIYCEVVTCLDNMDEEWSLLAFVTVLNGMLGLFWCCYIVTFYSVTNPADYSNLLCFAITFLGLKLLILFSASTTNELLAKIKIGFRCITYRISTPHLEIRRRLKEYLTRETRLTLWKIYVMDMPFVITSFGALLTYGMLLGTLGKTS